MNVKKAKIVDPIVVTAAAEFKLMIVLFSSVLSPLTPCRIIDRQILFKWKLMDFIWWIDRMLQKVDKLDSDEWELLFIRKIPAEKTML